jgi:hypothetical protein
MINFVSAIVALLHKPMLIGQVGYVTSCASEFVAIFFAGSITREIQSIHSFSEIAAQGYAGLAAAVFGAVLAVVTLRTESKTASGEA